MGEPRHFTSQAQKSNALGDHEIDNDNGAESSQNTHHWIRNSILHLVVTVGGLLRVQNFARIGVEVRLLLLITH